MHRSRCSSASGSRPPLGVLVLCALMLMLVARRVWRRGRREYALYELHLSTHDQAKGQDLEDMVESIANIVRAWPAERIRNGQPYLALELICGVAPANGGPLEMEWSINIRCEPRSASALDGAISATYPDVRLGRIHGEQPRPRPGVLREPGLRDAVPQGAQLRLLADRRRRGAGVRAARADRARPGRGRGAHRRPLPADPDPGRGSKRSPGACTAGTRTSSCARNAGGCPREG